MRGDDKETEKREVEEEEKKIPLIAHSGSCNFS